MVEKEDLRIIFMGTPEFAVASLDILVKNNYNIVGVVTATDKPAGRGNKLQTSAVKQYAEANQLKVLQPEKLKSPEFIEQLKALKPNLFVVVAFRMLPEIVWDMPQFGTFNLHASLLPQYRGAAPINWALINGEKETGVTTFFLQHEIDTGNIIFQDKIQITEQDNVGSVHDKLMQIGAELVLKTVQAVEKNEVQSYAQISNLQSSNLILQHAPKIFKETCLINWNNSAENVQNLIRGLSPYPAAFTYLDNKTLKIYSSIINEERNLIDTSIGNFYTDGKTFLSFRAADTFIDILELQLEGKKKMTVQEFLRGHRFNL
ncbi:MAG TPA: methionyl-tRNA formyltransferase [Chitinophagales bacterium]|nr:methionyl-tRNA formyltransferase [Chitinophagales bacterium]HMV03788.1 methionyl-tRNA formyltransferase [Chitinophagales bacterium]HMZ68940.1 methionyl-tRNA formyltransferase [Chitinophagales bacterium]HMZ93580.1 methionyl-tRNA formyltransferase [Chitinophagales bacterium]HNB38281.1 methionyl-tRNA formyltransferase [Chitinophagales bacterium]